MQTLTLREYEDYPVNFSLEKGQLSALAEAHIAVRPSVAEGQTYVLQPSSYIGTAHIGGLHVVVRPKVCIDRVMFLVAYAMDPKNWRQYNFDLIQATDVLESIIPAFVHHTRQAVRRGLLQGYRRQEEAQHTVRGRIRFDEQIKRRFGVPLPIEVVFDEFTEDIEENRLIKAALHRLACLPARSHLARRDVNALRPGFDTVELSAYNRGTPEVQYTRLNNHYRPAVELARLIIENSSLELHHGEVTGASFLMDMNKVFERFLYVALQEELKLSKSEWIHEKPLTLDEASAIKLNPDLVWWSGGRCRFVGDAKYKRLNPDAPNADIYQMLAYCIAADLPSGLLIYAKGESESGVHRIRNANKTIEVASIDLEGEPEAILKEVGRLACKIKAHDRQELRAPVMA